MEVFDSNLEAIHFRNIERSKLPLPEKRRELAEKERTCVETAGIVLNFFFLLRIVKFSSISFFLFEGREHEIVKKANKWCYDENVEKRRWVKKFGTEYCSIEKQNKKTMYE